MRLRFHQTGKPAEVLRLEPDEPPAPAAGQVRVRMLFAPVHPADLNFIEGVYGRQPELPAVPGNEGCGKVAAVGAGVTDLSVGDTVIALRPMGCWSQHLVSDASAWFRVPGTIHPHQAAMLRINPGTAWHLLTHFRTLKPGDFAAQNAANSAVGRAVIQTAKHLGLRTINFARRADVFAELHALGADACFTDDAAGLAAAQAHVGRAAPSLALNAVGGESALHLMDLLAPGGTHVTYGAMSRRSVNVPNKFLIFKDLTFRGAWISRWMEQAPREESDEMLHSIVGMMEARKLNLPVDSVHELKAWPEAIQRAQEGGRSGKVLLKLGDEAA